MADIKMKDAIVKVDNSGGTPVDISGNTNTISITGTRTNSEYYNFASDDAKVIEGGKSQTISLQIIVSDTQDEGYDLLADWWETSGGGERTVTIQYPDATAGSYQLVAEAVLTSFNYGDFEAGSAEPMMIEATMMCSGGITRTVIAGT